MDVAGLVVDKVYMVLVQFQVISLDQAFTGNPGSVLCTLQFHNKV